MERAGAPEWPHVGALLRTWISGVVCLNWALNYSRVGGGYSPEWPHARGALQVTSPIVDPWSGPGEQVLDCSMG